MTHVITSKAALYGAAAENSKLTEIIFEKKIWHREEINLRHGVVRHMSLHKTPPLALLPSGENLTSY